MRTKDVEVYFTDGCGRCSLFGTAECKVHTWAKELKLLRKIANDSPLTEECKWGVPTYTFQGKNVVMIGAFKEYCTLSFLKGALLSDPEKILVKPGENSQSTLLYKVTDYKTLASHQEVLKSYIYEATELEKSGAKVVFKKAEEHAIPQELEIIFDAQPALKAAFYNLTPGRQRGYLIHFTQPKQTQTRTSRIEKCAPKILAGKGFFD